VSAPTVGTSNGLAAAVETAAMARQGRPESGEIRFLCPAHDDHHPSARYNPQKGTWCCDACKAGGGILSLAKLLNVATPGQQNGKVKRQIVDTYDYHDEAGQLLFQTVRFSPKDFQQRQPDGQGNWIYNLKGVRRVLYHLPELLAADPANWVFVDEGEKDVETLRRHGMVATCNPMGAGKWRAEYAQFLRYRRVAILVDNDKPGRDHGQDVAKSLQGVAAEVKLVDLPGLPEKGDVSDWLALGHQVAELVALVNATPEWAPAPAPTAASAAVAAVRFNRTDLGNARWLVALHGQDLRYCHPSKEWYVWDGRRWGKDATAEVIRRAKATVATIYAEAASAVDDDERKAIAKHAMASEDAKRIRSMVAMAESEPGIPVLPAQLDANPWLFNCLNGTVDLKTGALCPHRREDLLTRLAPIEYWADAQLDLWGKFLQDATGGDAELAAFLQRAAGYSLTGLTTEEVLFFVHGPAAAGKSTFLETLKAHMGDYATTADFETFLIRRDVGSARPDIARLAGSRFVASIEVDQGKKLAEGLVKMLTGGDTVTARHLYQSAFEFQPAFKLWLAANHAPAISEDDEAMWRRVLRVPFEREVPKSQRDPMVKLTLKDCQKAGPAVLAWAVRGCLEWQQKGLGVPTAVEKATADLRRTMDKLQDFIDDCCVLDAQAHVEAGCLRKVYEEWAKERGETQLLKGRAWGEKLKARGCQRDRGTGGVHIWRGIRLLGTDESAEVVTHSAKVTDSDQRISKPPLVSSHEGTLLNQESLSVTESLIGHSEADGADQQPVIKVATARVAVDPSRLQELLDQGVPRAEAIDRARVVLDDGSATVAEPEPEYEEVVL